MRFHRILSIVLILLLLTSVTVPAASAGEVFPAAFAIPATAELLVDGALITIIGAGVTAIAKSLGVTWDNTKDGWNQLLTGIGHELTKITQSRKMIDTTSPRGEAILAFDYYTAGAGDKKPDKVYHKAKLKNKKVKIDLQGISEDEAVKELRNGKDIFAPNQDLAYKVTERASRENYDKLKIKNHKIGIYDGIKIDEDIELHGEKEGGYYDHYHPKYQGSRPHAWMRWGS